MEKGFLETDLLNQGYTHLKWIKFQGKKVLCGLYHFIYTTGLVIDMDQYGYYGRYCFENHLDARIALMDLEELNDLRDLPGEWIVYKGRGGELRNAHKNL